MSLCGGLEGRVGRLRAVDECASTCSLSEIRGLRRLDLQRNIRGNVGARTCLSSYSAFPTCAPK